MQLLTAALVTATIGLMVVATVLGLVVHRLLKQRRAADKVWAETTAERLSKLGHPFSTTSAGQVRGSISGRTAVLARSHNGALPGPIAAVVTLHLPLAHTDSELPSRPNLRRPSDGASHRFGSRWVQVWSEETGTEAAPTLLARAITLAAAAEQQQTAPWALFAGQRGLDFKASRQGESCVIEGEVGGVPVHVHLDGTHKPPVRTVIIAAFPRRGRSAARVGAHPTGPIGSMSLELANLLSRYEDAEVGDDSIRLHLPGMVIDDLDERISEAVALAKALSSSATS